MANKSSDVCREIVASSSVIQATSLEILIEHLVATGKLSKSDCKKASELLNRNVELQMNSLIDRVLNHFSTSS